MSDRSIQRFFASKSLLFFIAAAVFAYDWIENGEISFNSQVESFSLVAMARPTIGRQRRRDDEEATADAINNPYRFFTFEATSKVTNLGKDVLTRLAALGAPVVGRKMNPQLLLEWISKNQDKIGKIR